MVLLLTILVPATFAGMLLVERLRPARKLPVVRGWLAIGTACFLVTAALQIGAPVIAIACIGPRLLDLAMLDTIGGGLVGFVASDLAAYGMHRWMHTQPQLWRWTHQLHHSAVRVDVAGGAYFHPLDTALQVVTTTAVVLVLGITPDAAALAAYLGLVAGMVPHMNVSTPLWLGWFVQRPEAHAVHHARDVHAYNYGKLPLWDIAFGTFRNPATFAGPAGFRDGASRP